MTCRTAKIDQTSLSQHDNRVTIWECIAVYLRFNFIFLYIGLAVQPGHVDFQIEVANVADNRVVFHGFHMLPHDNIAIASGGNKQIAL